MCFFVLFLIAHIYTDLSKFCNAVTWLDFLKRNFLKREVQIVLICYSVATLIFWGEKNKICIFKSYGGPHLFQKKLLDGRREEDLPG